jgi:hypothetical protein
MERYSGVSGALLALSQRGAAVRFHWPLRSGYLVSIERMGDTERAGQRQKPIEPRSMFSSRYSTALAGSGCR